VKALLLDLDDTLLDYSGGVDESWRDAVKACWAPVGVTRDGLDAALAREYAARRRAVMQLFPDARETLDLLRRRGIPLGLVTNGDASQQRDKIERFGLAPYFEVMVIEGEFGAGKPDEAVYRHALGRLGVAPRDTWMVGDHLEFDIDGSQRLGLRGIWIDRQGAGLTDSPIRPYRIIRSLRELMP